MNFYLALSAMSVFAIAGVVSNVLSRRYDIKLWIIVYVISVLVVSFFAVPVCAAFLNRDFLERTTHYMSGGDMDGYQFVFFIVLIVYGFISNFLGAKITGTPFSYD